jgi:hypothetical protein
MILEDRKLLLAVHQIHQRRAGAELVPRKKISAIPESTPLLSMLFDRTIELQASTKHHLEVNWVLTPGESAS